MMKLLLNEAGPGYQKVEAHQLHSDQSLAQESRPTFGLYQICFDRRQRPQLDPAFKVYDNTENLRPEWREFHVFRKEWLAGTMDRSTYTGFLSPKFREKARIEGQVLLDFAEADPSADCYFINPFPDEVVRFLNVWFQGEHCHPGLIETTEELFRKIGYTQSLGSSVHPFEVACYCNFWFANRRFWQAYMDFCLPIYDYIENRASPSEKAKLWSRADAVSDSALVPFIFERLFTEFLVTHPEFKVRPFRYSSQHLKTRFHKRFTEMQRASEALKRAHTNNPDLDLVLSFKGFSRSTVTKLNRKSNRQKAKYALIDLWNNVSGKPPWVLSP